MKVLGENWFCSSTEKNPNEACLEFVTGVEGELLCLQAHSDTNY